MGLALLVSLFVEISNLSTFCEYNYVDSELEVYPALQNSMESYSYSNGIVNEFVKTDEDPRIIFNNVNSSIEGVLIKFSEPIHNKTSIQIYYSTDEFTFNEGATWHGVIPSGCSEYLADVSFSGCNSLRLDIEGDFNLEKILVSENDYQITEVKEQFSFFRLLIVIVLVLGVFGLLYMWKIKPESKTKLTKSEMTFAILCGVFYFIWSITKPYNYAPDEYMRYAVSQFLFENNRLPINAEVIDPNWGFSYAHYPTVLCNILSYIPMKIVGLFTNDFFALVVAARFVSVISGFVIVVFVIKTSKLLFPAPYNWVMIVFVSMIPQFVFLSSYLNNDIVSLAGAACILYAWCMIYKSKWNAKSSVILAVGISICALSYYNSYGWILLSIIYFIIYFVINKDERKNLLKYGGIISAIVLCSISYFFIREYIIYSDLLGFSTVERFTEIYAPEGHKHSQLMQTTIQGMGFSVFDMLFMNIVPINWLQTTYLSFIECFGYMSVYGQPYVYYVYSIFFLICIYALAVHSILYLKNKNVIARNRIDIKNVILHGCIIVSMIIPVALSIMYSYGTSYQPQGRYCYTAVLGIGVFATYAVKLIVSRINSKKVQEEVVCSLGLMFASITVFEFFTTYLPS